jgi:hypothetical protein
MAFFIILLVALPLPAMSQENTSEATGQETRQKRFAQEELAQLLAPIALYPDELISQVLMAATYPLEVVAADRWVEKNPGLKDDDLAEALEAQDWDPSVKSLVNFPSVLAMMSQKLEITSKLGDAFLSQEADVMATIQMLRKKAVDAGNLKTSREQTVIVDDGAVTIQPTTPEVVYVPTYDPLVVYGPWFYPAYPPYPFYFYAPPALGFFAFTGAVTLGLAWGYAWGDCNWHSHSIFVDVNRRRHIGNRHINHSRYVNYYERRRVTGPDGRGEWRHDPSHRRGVAYRDSRTAERFGQTPGRITRSREARGFAEGRSADKGDRLERRSPGSAPADIRRRIGTVPDGQGRSNAPARRTEGKAAGSGTTTIPRQDRSPGSSYMDGNSTRSASERGRSSREFSGSDEGSGSGSFGHPGGGDRSDGGGRSGGGRSESSGGGRGGGSRR